MHCGIIHRKGTINGTKFKYQGKINVEYNNSQHFSCVILKISNLDKLRAIDQPNYELGKRPFLSLDKYGYTEYGANLLRKSGKIP
jgi:hypothetical protein